MVQTHKETEYIQFNLYYFQVIINDQPETHWHEFIISFDSEDNQQW